MSAIKVGGFEWFRELDIRPAGPRGEVALTISNLQPDQRGQQTITLGPVQLAAVLEFLQAMDENFNPEDWEKIVAAGGAKELAAKFAAGSGVTGMRGQEEGIRENHPDVLDLDERGCCIYCGSPAIEEDDLLS